MSSLEKKRKRKITTTKKKKLSPNPSLPDDLLLDIVARVPRLYYPTLSLVSKSFRSLLASPELYKARSSFLGHTESCLYVCLRCCPGYRWFTLCRKPDQTLSNDTTKKKPSGYVLAPVPIPSFHKPRFSSLVVVGSDIYNIHGPSSNVSILDCRRSHTWREVQSLILDCRRSRRWPKAPSLPVEHLSLSASVLGQKIYVAGCYNDIHLDSSFFEVFDTKTKVWVSEPIPYNPYSERKYNFLHSKSICIDGKIHVVTDSEGVVAYNSKEGRWDLDGLRLDLDQHMRSDSYCEIENVLYSVYNRMVIWYDTEASRWRYLEGLVGLPTFPLGGSVRLGDYGGKLVVLWEEDLLYCLSSFVHKKKIWCAEISLERRESYEIFGKVEWFDHVLTIPKEYDLVKVLAATV
ncbi:F-box-like domain superfamily [Arabidopsis thaliana x Arabidopsis arenosa]|uniref:F-box-like domain superfamily n=1 Tax=Arabidopsis thaliana x Arabidopsis arenosa TaxID=1240361 RepID=A0A8T2AR79_9BRAS|nr:F-box-like domain superfamily [Arabidopsis thaliana x Arabidopsis arenosa]